MRVYGLKQLILSVALSMLFYAPSALSIGWDIKLSLCDVIGTKHTDLMYENLNVIPELSEDFILKHAVFENGEEVFIPKEHFFIYIKSGIVITEVYGKKHQIARLKGIKQRVHLTDRERKMLLKMFHKGVQEANAIQGTNYKLDAYTEPYIQDYGAFVSCLNQDK